MVNAEKYLEFQLLLFLFDWIMSLMKIKLIQNQMHFSQTISVLPRFSSSFVLDSNMCSGSFTIILEQLELIPIDECFSFFCFLFFFFFLSMINSLFASTESIERINRQQFSEAKQPYKIRSGRFRNR